MPLSRFAIETLGRLVRFSANPNVFVNPLNGNTRSDPRGPLDRGKATLMERVFEVDVLLCKRCSGRMRILAAIDSPDAILEILTCLGLPTRAPPIAPAISDPDMAYAW